jgi:NADH dehydrogenase
MTILVAGGTGFVGRHIVSLLKKNGYNVIVYHRGLRSVPTHADMIVNCIGIIREERETFHEAHIDVAKWLTRLGKKLRVKHFVQISAIGVEHESTSYQRTKAAAERIVKSGGLSYTIIRPSIIFGNEDKSINQFRKICRTGFFPLFGNGKVQPVHVDVVAQVAVAAVQGKLNKKTVEVAGPEVFTYAELAERLHPGVRTMKLSRATAKILTSTSGVFTFLPTKDMVTMLRQDNTTRDKTVEKLGIKNIVLQ